MTASAVLTPCSLAARPALSQASPATPTNPMRRPSTRIGPSRSRSHSAPIAAAHSGVAALKIADSPALIASSATP